MDVKSSFEMPCVDPDVSGDEGCDENIRVMYRYVIEKSFIDIFPWLMVLIRGIVRQHMEMTCTIVYARGLGLPGDWGRPDSVFSTFVGRLEC